MDFGVFKRKDLLRRGHTDSQIKKALRHGTLIRLRDGWYAHDSADSDAVAAVRKGGALSCISALQKHGFWVPPGHQRLHVRASRHHHGGGHGFCRSYGGPYPIERGVDDMPLALLCAAQCVSGEYWIAIADSVLRRRKLTVTDLRSLLPCVPPAVERLLRQCEPESQSGTESIARVRLRKEGFKVVVQPDVKSDEGHADLRIGRLLIECDSVEFHLDRHSYQYDRYRDRKSLIGRWYTMRFTYDDILWGWKESLADIREFTRAERHRMRKRRLPR